VSELRAASLGEVPPGQPRLVELDHRRLVLIRIAEQVYCLGDTCAHKGGPLADGKLSGNRLACPWHGWIYDVRTGQCLFPGRGASVPSYKVRIDDDEIFVEIKEAP
jgi:nitrite reductase/ring-hydroxylating ferredoxin subunit